jgi:Na+-transporting NADH:ubiquinone oxidoreductase subunit NqrC
MSHSHHVGMTISVDGASSAPLGCVGVEPFLQYWPADAGLPPALWAWSVPGRCSSLRC